MAIATPLTEAQKLALTAALDEMAEAEKAREFVARERPHVQFLKQAIEGALPSHKLSLCGHSWLGEITSIGTG